MEIYTIGYGNRQPADFFKLLQDNKIDVVLDVRREHTRSWATAYTPKVLEAELAAIGIVYKAIIRLSNTCESLEEYDEWLNTTGEGERAMGLLCGYLEIMVKHKKNVVLMCAELRPEKCHRKIITDFLAEYGYEVHHL